MNKRYYEHTLPIIRGSLSNTYTQFSTGNKLLKVPRTVIRNLVIGLPSGGDGGIVDDPTA
ncbi:hypothetical protein [Bacteroides hominis]|uniref:hypothetical protein n=1 Tax=Bacteroides hominis TaxID=2763023 RepID=UPI00345CE3D6